MSITFMEKIFCGRVAALRRALLFIAGMLLAADGVAMADEPLHPIPAKTRPEWHSEVMPLRTNLPAIHFYNKINPLWWFGNSDEPRAPDWYRPDGQFRNFYWHMRNPLENFTNYVIGVGDKESVRSGWYPTQNSDPHGGWNFAVTRRRIVYLPFLDYKRGGFEFYFGWRERGNFGIKLNFNQAPGRTPKKNLDPMPEISPHIVVTI
jgi:hypothetical protein